jgi:hypothetical protein
MAAREAAEILINHNCIACIDTKLRAKLLTRILWNQNYATTRVFHDNKLAQGDTRRLFSVRSNIEEK